MFCGKCGTQNGEGAMFCAGCGADLSGENWGNQPTRGAVKKNRNIGLFAVIAGVVALVAVLVLLFGGRSAKSTVKKYMNASIDADAAKIMKLIPKKVINEAKDEMDMDKDDWNDYIDDLSESIQDNYDWIEDYYGGKLKITYEIVDEEDVDKDDLEDIQDDYKDEFDIKVKDAKEIEVEMTMKIGSEKQETTVTVALIKVGNTWYLDIMNMDLF